MNHHHSNVQSPQVTYRHAMHRDPKYICLSILYPSPFGRVQRVLDLTSPDSSPLAGSPPCLRLERIGVLADPLPGDLLTGRKPHVGVGREGLDDVLERLESTGLADEAGVKRYGGQRRRR